ncbi:MAG: putative intracellular protease/amidase [Planctomycetota bacterium]|jgi:putative intracellular protease/amidase
MAKKKEEKIEPTLDADGIVVHEYEHTVLVIVSPDGFGEQGVCFARSMLTNVRIASLVASTRYDEVLKGRLQEFFLADMTIDEVDPADYCGVLISAGEIEALASNERVLQVVREIAAADKLVSSFGNGVEVLARAGVIKGRLVTGARSCEQAVKKAGGKFTTKQVQESGNIVTGFDECSGIRFGRAMVDAIVRLHSKAS